MSRWVPDNSWAELDDSRESVPERSLWASVLALAATDVRIGTRELVDAVEGWVLRFPKDFDLVCGNAGIDDVEAARHFLLKLIQRRRAGGYTAIPIAAMKAA